MTCRILWPHALIVGFGVKQGIEKANRIMMPALIVMSIALMIYVLTLPGAFDGVAYYLTPDITKLSPELFIAAMGQMFYSLSLAMGITIAYGSYMENNEDIEKSVHRIECFDTDFAFLFGLMIVPIAFVAMGSGEAVASQ